MKKILVLFFFLISLLWGNDATLSIVNENATLPKIIVRDYSVLQDLNLKRSFYNILINDLKVSSNFEIVDEGNENVNYVFEYALSRNNNILNLNVKIKAGGIYKSDQNYTLPSVEQYPFLAHKSVKDSVNFLGLAPVEWMDHKILIARTSSSKRSQIIMADYTLTYQKVMVDGGLNLFPKWGDAKQNYFYYTAYAQKVPTLYRYDLRTNQITKILSSTGMIVASDVSEDERKILVTMAPEDQPDVYLYDLTNKTTKRLTNFSGVDVNGNFIEKDTKFVFISDRLGYPNVFMQSLDGNVAQQVVFHGRNNSAVSTYENYIVYSSREENKSQSFNIYLMSTESDYIRQLTANGKNIFPKFSSDGGSIVFIKFLGSQSALGVIRVNANKTFYFPLKVGKIQSIDW